MLGPKGAGLIRRPMTSGDFARWGSKGKGNWITSYGDSGHVFVVIAGLRFDTSQPDDGNSGPGWSKNVEQGLRERLEERRTPQGRPLVRAVPAPDRPVSRKRAPSGARFFFV